MHSRTVTVAMALSLGLALVSCASTAESQSAAATEPALPSTEPESSIKPTPRGSAPAPSEPVGPITVAWAEPESFDGQPGELFVDGDTWIAGGRATERGPAAWTSGDGRTWTRATVPDPQPDDLFPGAGLGPITRLGDSLLSFGTFIGCCDGRGVIGWRSADGTSWESIESTSPLFQSGYLVLELATGDGSLLAVETQYGEFAGRLWRWSEETSWVETTPGGGAGQPSGLQAYDVAWSEDRYVVVGTRGDPANLDQPHGASWVSADGQSWEESAPGAELEGVQLVAVAPLPAGGYAALGWDYARVADDAIVPLAFTSRDGVTWTRVADPFGAARWRPEDLVATDDGLLGFGAAGGETVVWTTLDGESWTDAGALPYTYQDAAALADEVIVFTADFDGSSGWHLHRGTLGREG